MIQNPNTMPPPEAKAIAPWQLDGDGYIFLYKFPKWFVQKHGFLSASQHRDFKGYFGTVMLVDYKTSAVGPYQELLFIPGMFDVAGKNRFSITKIYVSTYNSVWNGINNWAIPKQVADFKWETIAKKKEKIEVSMNDKVFFSAILEKKWLKFPLTTALLPINLVQTTHQDNLLLTQPTASGQGQLASLTSVEVDAEFFPDISLVKPIMVLAANRFKMIFPIAKPG
jgi:hypothetical protein